MVCVRDFSSVKEHYGKVHYLRVNAKQFKDSLLAVGFQQGSFSKTIPDVILQSSLEVQKGFVKGLWLADGYVLFQRSN